MRSQNGERLQNHSLHAGSNWIFIVALLCLAPGCSSDVVDVVDVENTADAPPGHVVPRGPDAQTDLVLESASTEDLGVETAMPQPGARENADGQAGGEPSSPTGEERQEDVFIPAPATLHRLSTAERRASVKAVFDVVPTLDFEQETSLHGSVRVANAELTISPQLTEQLEAFAWALVEALQNAPEKLQRYFPCPLQAGSANRACIGAGILELGRALWRRPLDQTEMDRLIVLYETLRGQPRTEMSHRKGILGIVAALVQSPDFVFRVEIGEPIPGARPDGDPVTWRYTSDEMASRLSYFIWGRSPDAELRAAADDGSLLQDDTLRSHAIRLLNDPQAIPHFAAYFDELMGLEFLETVSKNGELFPDFSQSLRASMRAEMKALFTAVAFEEDADFRDLLTSEQSSVDSELAAIYGVQLEAPLSPGERVTVTLPPEHARGGLLGRAAPLTLFSHATVNSPTFRGRFVRSGLLCQDVPPPPEGVVTELEEQPEGVPQTLRERLQHHATEPQCAGCHQLMDPLGFPLERFDPIGRWRDLDNGLAIDSTGNLDGVPVDGAKELGQAVAGSPSFSKCMTKRLFRYAVSHLEDPGEITLIDTLDGRFTTEHGYRFKALVLEVVMSDAFRRLSRQAPAVMPDGGDVAIHGCGGVERCNGVDNDCDGVVDEAVVEVCEMNCGLRGVRVCSDGEWSSCDVGQLPSDICDNQDNDCDGEVDEDAGTTPELCDGEDNDCDGVIDEEVGHSVREVSFDVLTGFHDGCRIDQRDLSHCNAAINRFCQSLNCGGTGFGPIESGWPSVSVVCIPEAFVQKQQVTYQALAERHEVCDGERESVGPNCNAAIHRHCAQAGLVTGFGTLERGAGHADIACVPGATVVETTYGVLSSHHGDCHESGERHGPNCNAAINRFCRARGFRSGWGPLENSGDIAVVSCVD